MLALREQTLQNFLALFGGLQWFVRYDLHKCDVV